MSAHKKLMQARLELQGKKLEKTGHNKFAGYKYFELGDFIPTIQEIFNGLGLCGVVSYGTELATLTITDIDEPSSAVVISSPMSSAALKGCHEVQNLGAVETYIRRYLWVTALEIVEHDALDATTGHDDKRPTRAPCPSGKITPLTGAEDDVPEDEKPYLRELADILTDTMNGNGQAAAFNRYSEENLENEQKNYLWSLLPSNVRSAIKKEGELRKQAPKAA